MYLSIISALIVFVCIISAMGLITLAWSDSVLYFHVCNEETYRKIQLKNKTKLFIAILLLAVSVIILFLSTSNSTFFVKG